jgi:hypothetical protein
MAKQLNTDFDDNNCEALYVYCALLRNSNVEKRKAMRELNFVQTAKFYKWLQDSRKIDALQFVLKFST